MSKPGCLRFTAVTKSEATKRFRSIDIVREDTRENCRSLRSRVKGSRDSRSKGIANRNGEKYLRWSSDAFEEKRREVSLSLSGYVTTHQLPLCAGSEIGVRAETTHVEDSTPTTFEIAYRIPNDIDPDPLRILEIWSGCRFGPVSKSSPIWRN